MRDKIVLIFLFGCLCTVSYAVEYAPFADSGIAPAATMQSVNNAGYISSGSAYSSTVYEVGSSAPSRAGARKAFPSVTPSTVSEDYDPSNPQFAPLGDPVIPLLLIVAAYSALIYIRRKREK